MPPMPYGRFVPACVRRSSSTPRCGGCSGWASLGSGEPRRPFPTELSHPSKRMDLVEPASPPGVAGYSERRESAGVLARVSHPLILAARTRQRDDSRRCASRCPLVPTTARLMASK
jgi:hypothetical protein